MCADLSRGAGAYRVYYSHSGVLRGAWGGGLPNPPDVLLERLNPFLAYFLKSPSLVVFYNFPTMRQNLKIKVFVTYFVKEWIH